jgi:hypothetical protein
MWLLGISIVDIEGMKQYLPPSLVIKINDSAKT